MKKKYSLDYSIERDIDRLHAVEEILDTLETNPNPSELEQMASYILYGKDEEGKNAVQRGETTDSDKRYKSFQKAADKLHSLDEIIDNPLSDQLSLKTLDERYIYTKKKPMIARPKYDKKTGTLVDPGDSDIPGIQNLWDRIDYIEHVVAINEGKIPDDGTVTILQDSYRLYQLKHMLIDMRRHQYYLKDSYKPTLHFVAIQQPQPQTYNLDSDAEYWMTYDQWEHRVNNSYFNYSKNIDDYESKVTPDGIFVKWIVRHQNFDWENPKHIRALICHYSDIYMQLWDKLHSWGRTLIFDFDRYAEMAQLSPVREYILLRKIDKASHSTILQELQEKFGLVYNENHLSNILNKEIPEKIATAATKHRLEIETPDSMKKVCFRCKRLLPKNKLFFGVNNSRKDHWASNCKECERKRRIAKGGQTSYDRRSKDSTLHEMQARETNL